MSRPTLPDSPNDTPWPPKDGPSYIRSDSFGTLVIEIGKSMARRYRSMDFTDAAARVFAWFDRRLDDDAHFINAARFPTPSSFRAYVRQAIWNDARRTARDESRRRSVELDPQRPADNRGLMLPEEASALAEQIERLPEPHRGITVGLLLTGQEVADLAQSRGLSIRELQRIYEEAIDMLLHGADAPPDLSPCGVIDPTSEQHPLPKCTTARSEELLAHYESLPYIYKDAFHEIFCENRDINEVAEIRGIAAEELYARFEMALDFFCLHDAIGIGARLVMLSDDHRMVARCAYLEKMAPAEIADALRVPLPRVRLLFDEIEQYLIPGALNLIKALARLEEVHRLVFSRIFFGGESPATVASDLNVTAAQLDRIWSDAIHQMFQFTNPRAPGAPGSGR